MTQVTDTASSKQYIVAAACIVVHVGTKEEKYLYAPRTITAADNIAEAELERLLSSGLIVDASDAKAAAEAARRVMRAL